MIVSSQRESIAMRLQLEDLTSVLRKDSMSNMPLVGHLSICTIAFKSVARMSADGG